MKRKSHGVKSVPHLIRAFIFIHLAFRRRAEVIFFISHHGLLEISFNHIVIPCDNVNSSLLLYCSHRKWKVSKERAIIQTNSWSFVLWEDPRHYKVLWYIIKRSSWKCVQDLNVIKIWYFPFDPVFLNSLHPFINIGNCFIRTRYFKSVSFLFLLWV